MELLQREELSQEEIDRRVEMAKHWWPRLDSDSSHRSRPLYRYGEGVVKDLLEVIEQLRRRMA